MLLVSSMNILLVYIVQCDDDYFDAMLYLVGRCLWSFVLISWLSKVMVLYLVIALVGLMMGYG